MGGLGPLLGPNLRELIAEKRWDAMRDALAGFDPSDVAEVLIELPDRGDAALFRLLPR
jgi:Mg/Co/Ni transporter MgtE